MNYAILRVQKLKTNTAMRGSLKHAFRAQDTPNADPSRESENSHHGADSVNEAMAKYKDRLPNKVRKNGVRAIEYLVTSSPEKMHSMSRAEQDAFFADSLDWLKKKHGAENVVYSGVHRDETTPHMYAYVVPHSQERDQSGNLVKPNKLNCREFLGGREKLSEMQTEFVEKVAGKYGMERGEKKSRAKHTTIKEYYSRLENGAKMPDVPDAEFHPRETKTGMLKRELEGGSAIKARVMPQIEAEMKSLGAIVSDARDKLKRHKRAKDMAEKSLEHLSGVSDYRSLTPEHQEQIETQIRVLKMKEKLTKTRTSSTKKPTRDNER